MAPKKDGTPRDKGAGSVYQRATDGRWIGTFEAGWTAAGTRKRIIVSAKTEAQAKRKLRDKIAAHEAGETGSSRETVKSWAEKYLEIRVRDLAPNGFNAAASPVRRWIVPTIGHRRLDALTPADVRAVATAQRDAGRKTSTQAATQRALMTMLRHAIQEGHRVPSRILEVPSPKAAKSDRASMSVDEALAILHEASNLPDGSRWLFTMLYGARQGECLGLTWDAIDLGAGEFGEAIIEWQLQDLQYLIPRDRSSGFRVPDGYDAQHLVDVWHLVRPKSRQGYRVAPLLAPMRKSLEAWRGVTPANPWDLVWPAADGRPRNPKDDRAEWYALQERAGVAHPTGRPFHIHECRNFAATMLQEAGVDEHTITSLLGHSSIVMSRRYMTVRRAPLLDALTLMGERLQLGN